MSDTATQDDKELIRRYRAGDRGEETRAAWSRYTKELAQRRKDASAGN